MVVIPVGRLKELCAYYRERYSVIITPEQVNKHITEENLRIEIIEDSYLDTYPREWILEILAQAIVGDTWPTYGASDEYTSTFFKLAYKKGFVNVKE